VLDGLDTLPGPGPAADKGEALALRVFLGVLQADNPGLCLLTSRSAAPYPADKLRGPVLALEPLSREEGAQLLRTLGVRGSEGDLEGVARAAGGHPLTLLLQGAHIRDRLEGDARSWSGVAPGEPKYLLAPLSQFLEDLPEPEATAMRLLSLPEGP